MTTVTLVTGDQVTVMTAPGGRISYRLRPVSGRAFETFRAGGGDYYAIPASALPYAGRTLSLSLFDVSALVRDGLAAGARIPVTLSRAGGRPSTPPGVTPTSAAPRLSDREVRGDLLGGVATGHRRLLIPYTRSELAASW